MAKRHGLAWFMIVRTASWCSSADVLVAQSQTAIASDCDATPRRILSRFFAAIDQWTRAGGVETIVSQKG